MITISRQLLRYILILPICGGYTRLEGQLSGVAELRYERGENAETRELGGFVSCENEKQYIESATPALVEDFCQKWYNKLGHFARSSHLQIHDRYTQPNLADTYH